MKINESKGPTSGPDLAVKSNFEVYRQSYVDKLTEALHQTYSAIQWVTGDDLFHKVAQQYIETEPSVSYNLNDYGYNFTEYLKGHRLTRGIPFLPELARFEWTYKALSHRAPATPLPSERVSEILQTQDCRLQFIDAMEVFASPFRVSEMWLRKSEPAYMFEDIVWEYPEWVLLFKRDDEIFTQPINHTEASVIQELSEGAKVSEALLKYSAMLNPRKIDQLFNLIMKAGIIEDVLTDN